MHLYGWQDFGTPDLECLFDIVKIMSDLIDQGGKVLVHCHAGLGRTGLLIACHLIYTLRYTASEAVTLVRLRRAKAIQTKAQLLVTRDFEQLVLANRVIFTDTDTFAQIGRSRQQLCLEDSLIRQTSSLLMSELDTLGGLPKVAVFCLQSLKALCTQTVAVSQLMQHRTSDTNQTIQSAKNNINNGVWTELERSTNPHFVFCLFEDWLRQLSLPAIPESRCKDLHQSMTDASQKLPVNLDEAEGRLLVSVAHWYKRLSSIVNADPAAVQQLGGRISAAMLHKPWPADEEPERRRDSIIYTAGTFSIVLLWLSTHTTDVSATFAVAGGGADAGQPPAARRPADKDPAAPTDQRNSHEFRDRSAAQSFSRKMTTQASPSKEAEPDDFDDADLTELSEVAVAQTLLFDNDDAGPAGVGPPVVDLAAGAADERAADVSGGDPVYLSLPLFLAAPRARGKSAQQRPPDPVGTGAGAGAGADVGAGAGAGADGVTGAGGGTDVGAGMGDPAAPGKADPGPATPVAAPLGAETVPVATPTPADPTPAPSDDIAQKLPNPVLRRLVSNHTRTENLMNRLSVLEFSSSSEEEEDEGG